MKIEPIRHIEPVDGQSIHFIHIEMVEKFNQMIDVFNERLVSTVKTEQEIIAFCEAEKGEAARLREHSGLDFFDGKLAAYNAILAFLDE